MIKKEKEKYLKKKLLLLIRFFFFKPGIFPSYGHPYPSLHRRMDQEIIYQNLPF